MSEANSEYIEDDEDIDLCPECCVNPADGEFGPYCSARCRRIYCADNYDGDDFYHEDYMDGQT